MKQETKRIFKEVLRVLPFIILFVLISGVIGTIAHEEFHAWSMKDVTERGNIYYLNNTECGKWAIACYTAYMIPSKEYEYNQKLKTEEWKAYIITFIITLGLSIGLMKIFLFNNKR